MPPIVADHTPTMQYHPFLMSHEERARPTDPGANEQTLQVTVTVNGRAYRRTVPSRLLLSDFLRHELGLTGTHVGCEHGVCGACTILLDGETARSCLMFAVQADGC